MRELFFPETRCAESLFADMEETAIRSALEGYMGHVWTDGENPPRTAHIRQGDFHLFAGDARADCAREMLSGLSPGAILVAHGQTWRELIEKTLGERVVHIKRYAFYKNPAHLDIGRISRLMTCPQGFTLKRIDEALAEKALSEPWSRDFVSQFSSASDYVQRGLGMCVLYRDELVCGASSYYVYRGGLEVEIDTRPDFRRRGLATAAAAALIKCSLEKKLYPSWDAANLESVGLAEKLGYKMKKAYDAFFYKTC